MRHQEYCGFCDREINVNLAATASSSRDGRKKIAGQVGRSTPRVEAA